MFPTRLLEEVHFRVTVDFSCMIRNQTTAVFRCFNLSCLSVTLFPYVNGKSKMLQGVVPSIQMHPNVFMIGLHSFPASQLRDSCSECKWHTSLKPCRASSNIGAEWNFTLLFCRNYAEEQSNDIHSSPVLKGLLPLGCSKSRPKCLPFHCCFPLKETASWSKWTSPRNLIGSSWPQSL